MRNDLADIRRDFDTPHSAIDKALESAILSVETAWEIFEMEDDPEEWMRKHPDNPLRKSFVI